MPAYDFECNECGHRLNDVTFKISEYDELTLKDKPCQTVKKGPDGQPMNEQSCPGIYEHTFTKPAVFSFKGGAPTPRFHHGGNQG
jgi:predicted nucleic acid-binding Zn ribbon protein